LKVLEIIEREELLENARQLGAKLSDGIRALNSPRLREVRAIGLMIGFELEEAGDANSALAFVKRLMAAGLLAIPAGERVIRLLPPLNVTATEVDEALEKIKRTLQEG
jgi:acetylornithine/succinyldiaminopimelate/putrescine aminotransferase